jgi:PST family polysaccharide transporter
MSGKSTQPDPLVSVVVPTCDRSAETARCLEALAAQTWSRLEIVVVDDGSRDDTPAMLERFVAAYDGLDIVTLRNEENLGANASRNRGVGASRGQLVAFLDSDCVAEPDWIERLVAGFDNDRVVAVTGLVRDPEPSNIYELTFLGTHRVATPGPARRLVAGNLCVRRDALLEHGWCERGQLPPTPASGQPDVSYSGACDEEALFLRLKAAGATMVARPDAVVLHDHRYAARSFFKQAYHGGRAAADLVFRHRLRHRTDMIPFMLAYATLVPAAVAMQWTGPVVLALPGLLMLAALAAITFNDLVYKGKTVGQWLRSFPMLVIYYHVRLAGYVSKMTRLVSRLDRVERLDLRPGLRAAALRTDDLQGSLARRSARSGAIVLGTQVATTTLGVIGAAILARLLTPDDFGLLAMAMAFLAFVTPFADLGLPQSTIQRAEVTHEQVSAVFWINLALSLAATVVGILVARPVAAFYGRPELVAIATALAAAFVISGLGAQCEAVLRRRMQFALVSGIGLVAAVTGLVVGVIVAARGGGYWALVAMPLTGAAVRSGLAWMISPWRPGPPARAEGVGSMIRFGGFLAGTGLLGTAVRNVDRILIGRFLGAATAGFYINAYRLLLIPLTQLNAPLTNVAVPTLSRLQDDPERFRRFYRRGVEIIGAVTLPAVVASVVMAEELILTVLGDQWRDSVPIFLALAPAALLASLNVVTSWAYVPLGRTGRQFRWHVVRAACLLAGFAIGLQWGAVGVAAALSIVNVTLRVPGILYCFHGTFLRLRDVGAAVWRSAAAATLAAAATRALTLAVDSQTPAVALVVGLACFGLTYPILWITIPGGRREATALADTLRLLRNSRGDG